ncbi:hypothetical protein NA57DRAFT_48253 [Rhizodiscina lignyota]|uniref:Uncharacterized protein n=1 Tax=Rhizodiscina lignyota TaxID=1504668 RepID=A0A9P4M3J9_9PEZI|nr:hypothetical protein NA57DRAFT_48253 [Rhizodiscina lignyota]
MPDCNGSPARDMWQRTIPQVAFESEVVLNPMLALSALHLHAHSPNNSTMAVALRRYLDQSLVHHRQALRSPGKELSEQLWLSAVILSNIYWLLARQLQPDEVYEVPLGMWKLMQGVSMLFIQEKSYLGRLGYGWFGDEPKPRVLTVDELPSAARAQLQSVEEDLAYLLDAFDVPTLPEDDRSTYMEAKDYVLYHYRVFYSGAAARTLRRYIGTMAVRCRPAYRSKLERHDALAMALMARVLVLLNGLEHAWWMNGEGDYKVLERDIPGMRELMPEYLRWTMDWPCKVLNRVILLNRS